MALRDKLAFEVGDALFRKRWVSAPASTRQSHGIGPLFNARGCQRCYRKDGRGHPPAADPRTLPTVSFTVHLGVPTPVGARPAPVYGSQLQDAGIASYAAEGHVELSYRPVTVRLADGQTVNPRAGFLHNGRARPVLGAILWHGGEATAARTTVTALPTAECARLLAFLAAL